MTVDNAGAARGREDGMVDVHDILTLGHRSWSVTSVCLGALGQESVIGLQALDLGDPASGPAAIPEMFVPEIIIRKALETDLMSRLTTQGAKP
ncbi:MAG: hypothetical protein ACYDD1_05475 [Caulobacteraceae bacterium]